MYDVYMIHNIHVILQCHTWMVMADRLKWRNRHLRSFARVHLWMMIILASTLSPSSVCRACFCLSLIKTCVVRYTHKSITVTRYVIMHFYYKPLFFQFENVRCQIPVQWGRCWSGHPDCHSQHQWETGISHKSPIIMIHINVRRMVSYPHHIHV